jgi:hypothetical protein
MSDVMTSCISLDAKELAGDPMDRRLWSRPRVSTNSDTGANALKRGRSDLTCLDSHQNLPNCKAVTVTGMKRSFFPKQVGA